MTHPITDDDSPYDICGVGGRNELANSEQPTQATAEQQAAPRQAGTGADTPQFRKARRDAKPAFDAQTARIIRLGVIESAGMSGAVLWEQSA